MAILYQSSLVRLETCLASSFNNFVYFAGPAFILVAVSLVSLVAYVYFTVNIPYLFPTNDGWQQPLRLVTVVWSVYMLVCIAFHYYMAVTVDPGRPPKEMSGDGEDNVADPNSELLFELRSEPNQSDYGPGSEQPPPARSRRICKKCRHPKPDRTHHCSVCRRVGHHNHRYFYLFLLYMFAVSTYYSAISIRMFRREILNLGTFTWPHEQARMGFVFSFVLAVAMALAMGAFLAWHSFLIATAQTTIEYYSNQVAQLVARSTGEFLLYCLWIYDRVLILLPGPAPAVRSRHYAELSCVFQHRITSVVDSADPATRTSKR
ncbi:hypothetical protein PhCBS80983_g02182 [Powellomyces hirtus]|uniref:Palmitoyltransferase n=1 Tax=Powellomyces hirtus TaxID=109895 RepID=A0A507E792_9FUNG|nr:hypothetical protein PhCBS80983_g02182 [Powellomyces hirtus]